MNHRASTRFWEAYDALPDRVRERADQAFALLRRDSRHPSLRFKKVADFWSVRVDRDFRALGIEDADGIVWIWIGSHADYERLIG